MSSGITNEQLTQVFVQSAINRNETKTQFEIQSGYFVATSIAATNTYCPQYKEKF
jgi:predicted TIM-barrel enzyme